MTRHTLGVSAALVDGRLVPGDVAVVDDVVEAVGLPPARGGRIAAPGLVDLQVNGFAGVDLMSADVADLHDLARALPPHGVTAWLPTLITAPVTDTDRALDRLTEAFGTPDDAGRGSAGLGGGARSLGVHLEGPYLSPRRLGTHPPQHRRDPDLAELSAWRRRADVVAVTLAPELPGALGMVKTLTAEGVLVSLGHSDATAFEAHAGFDAGARSVTHLFNAMSALQHREPGLPGAALARPDVTVQLVLDGHHLAPDVVRLVWAAARDRIVLVTDATAAAGRPDGRYTLAGVSLDVTDGVVRNSDGTLAGSALTLSGAVKNAAELGLDPASVLRAVTEAPATLLGRDDVGFLRPGARADVARVRGRPGAAGDAARRPACGRGRPLTLVSRSGWGLPCYLFACIENMANPPCTVGICLADLGGRGYAVGKAQRQDQLAAVLLVPAFAGLDEATSPEQPQGRLVVGCHAGLDRDDALGHEPAEEEVDDLATDALAARRDGDGVPDLDHPVAARRRMATDPADEGAVADRHVQQVRRGGRVGVECRDPVAQDAAILLRPDDAGELRLAGRPVGAAGVQRADRRGRQRLDGQAHRPAATDRSPRIASRRPAPEIRAAWTSPSSTGTTTSR